MRKLITILLFALAVQCHSQWTPMRNRVEYRDSVSFRRDANFLAPARFQQSFKLGAVTVTSNGAELNILDGALVNVTELNRLVGVTSGVQAQLNSKAPIDSPTFTGTVSGITKSMVGLGNVDNESKSTMFTNPIFSGLMLWGTDTVASRSYARAVAGSGGTGGGEGVWGLISGNLPDQIDLASALSGKVSTSTTVNGKALSGNISLTASDIGLGNVTNESKATMFTNPTFTGTVSGVTASMVGLGNVTNESKATMFASPTFTGTPTVPGYVPTSRTVNGKALSANISITASDVSLGNVTNESKATMFTSPTFTGTVTLPGTTSIGTVSSTEISYIDGAESNVQSQLNGIKTDLNDTIPIADVALLKYVLFNAQTGTTYTLALSDAGKIVTCSNTSSITVTVPLYSSIAFPTGTQITIVGINTGQVTIAAASGVTINSAGGALKLRVRYSSATLIKTAKNTWLLIGDITT